MYYDDEPDIYDVYGDAADAQIDEELDTLDDNFKAWVYDDERIPEDADDDDYAQAAKDPAIRDAYHEYRFEDICRDMAEREADYKAYCECERAEAMREAYLLGDY